MTKFKQAFWMIIYAAAFAMAGYLINDYLRWEYGAVTGIENDDWVECLELKQEER